MAKRPRREKREEDYVVVSYIDGERRLHHTTGTSYRNAKRKVARELREDLGLWDVNLEDLTARGMLVARKVPPKLFQ